MKFQKTFSLTILSALLGLAARIQADETSPELFDVAKYHNKSQAAFVAANRENKYLLVYFNSGDPESSKQMRDLFRHEDLANIANRCVLTDTNPDHDSQGKDFAEEYKIETFPSILLIKSTIDPKTLRVTRTDLVGRLKGKQSVYEIQKYLERAIAVYEKRGKVLDLTTHHDEIFRAWQQAKKNDKYFVVLFDSEYCPFCIRTLANMTDPRLGKYSDRLIFVDTDPDFDTDAQYFVDRFQVKKYPTILLMRPVMKPYSNEVKKVDLIGRMTGEQTAKEIDEYFEEALTIYQRQLKSEASSE